MKPNESLLCNEEIKDPIVLVIDADGTKKGECNINDALALAEAQDLDLVRIVSKGNVPVCKIMDYSKFKYEQSRKEKEMKKKQKVISVKEVQLSLNIEKHDVETKMKMTRKFLSSGNKVNIVLRLKGRERMFSDRGVDVVKNFIEGCSDISTPSKEISVQNNLISVTLSPIN